MKIFVTGIAGFLGSHLAEAFIREGHTVAGCDNLLGGYMDNVPAEANFWKIDCLALPMMKQALRGTEVVYHCAATPYEGLSPFSPCLIARNIVGASAATFAAAVSAGVRRVVFLSSMARYGRQKVPFWETMIPAPVDPYGIGKVAAEQILEVLGEVHGFEWVIAVPHNIYGPRQKYDDPFRNVAAIMANMMLLGEQPIIYGDGMQKRCFSYVDDCVAPLVRMATASVVGDVINIGPEDEFVTIKELARIIAKEVGVKLRPQYMPPRPLEVHEATCANAKAHALLGYRSYTGLREGIARLVAYIRQRGPRPFSYHVPIEIDSPMLPRTWREQLFPAAKSEVHA